MHKGGWENTRFGEMTKKQPFLKEQANRVKAHQTHHKLTSELSSIHDKVSRNEGVVQGTTRVV